MTAKATIPDWELVETKAGIRADGMFAVMVEVWAAKAARRFATFISERPVLAFKCPTTTQMRLSDSPPHNAYADLNPPSGDRREMHALSCVKREAWLHTKRKLGN